MRRILLSAVAALAMGSAAGQARATDVYAVLGTLGYDIERDSLPLIDFAIGPECVYQELDVGDVIDLLKQGGAFAVELEPGAYEAAVVEAGDSCNGAPLVTGRADVPASPLAGQGDDAAGLVVAELDASGAPRLRAFTVNTAALGGRRSRITLFHTAEAPALDLQLGRLDRATIAFAALGLENGAQTFPTDVIGRDYRLLVSTTPLRQGEAAKPLATFDVALEGDFSYALVLIGSLAAGTLDLIALRLPTAP